MGDFVNSRQVQFDKAFVSCGVMEAHHLPDQSGVKLAFSIANALYNKANPRPAAFVLFSDTVDSGRGQRLADCITGTIRCGQLSKFGPVVNPKTGNYIKVWVWQLDHDSFRKWYQDELANRVEESQG
jgi:hypothetical protein